MHGARCQLSPDGYSLSLCFPVLLPEKEPPSLPIMKCVSFRWENVLCFHCVFAVPCVCVYLFLRRMSRVYHHLPCWDAYVCTQVLKQKKNETLGPRRMLAQAFRLLPGNTRLECLFTGNELSIIFFHSTPCVCVCLSRKRHVRHVDKRVTCEEERGKG